MSCMCDSCVSHSWARSGSVRLGGWWICLVCGFIRIFLPFIDLDDKLNGVPEPWGYLQWGDTAIGTLRAGAMTDPAQRTEYIEKSIEIISRSAVATGERFRFVALIYLVMTTKKKMS